MKALYRIVNALLALAIVPTVLLMDFLYFRASTTIVDAGLHETLSAMDIINILRGEHYFSTFIKADSLAGMSWPSELDPIKSRLIATVVGFAVAIIACVFIIVWSICSNKRIPVLAASGIGLIGTIVMTACFNSAGNMVVIGAVDLIRAFSSGIVMSLVSTIINIEALNFAGFQNGMIIIFIMLIVWTLAFYIIEIGEPKEEKEIKKKH